eukprot:3282847-Amphidinium_carterae.1
MTPATGGSFLRKRRLPVGCVATDTGGRFKRKRRQPVGCCEAAEMQPPSCRLVELISASRQGRCCLASRPCEEMGAMMPQKLQMTRNGPPENSI